MVDSLETQFFRLTGGWDIQLGDTVSVEQIGWPQQINQVQQQVRALKLQHFKSPVFGRYPQRVDAPGEDVRFAFLSEYLNQDEMSRLLLGTHPASEAWDYRWNAR